MGVPADAIEDLYVLFSYDLPARLEYCTYCDAPEYEEALHRPLRTLEPLVVDGYVWDAIHHTGDGDDFKHFVPRILELVAADSLPYADIELVLGRLSDAGWHRWPVREQAAVTHVLEAMWESTMASYPASPDASESAVDELLCGLGRAFGDLDPLLRAWVRDPRLTARLHLRDVILGNAEALRAGKLSDPWWRQVSATMVSVAAWLRSGPVQEALLAALDQTEGEQRDLLQLAFDAVAYP